MAWVQVLIYVGAIVILFLFGLMLTRRRSAGHLDNQQRWLGVVVGIGVFAGLAFLIQDAFPVQDAEAFRTFSGDTAASAARSSPTSCCRSRRSRSCCWRP